MALGEQLFHLGQAVGGKALKLHVFPKKCIFPKKKDFWGFLKKSTKNSTPSLARLLKVLKLDES
jgi:hypothetical protein